MTKEEKKLFKRANKAIQKTEKALEKSKKLYEKEREAIDKFCECARKRLREDVADDSSHPFADDVLMEAEQ